MADAGPPLVAAVEIEDLFGSYSYSLDFTGVGGDGRSNRLSLLYGNNGTGKTTILRLIWHALSGSPDSGHRSSILKVPFGKFVIHLNSGESISFIRRDGRRSMLVQVSSGGRIQLEQTYIADADGRVNPVGPREPSREVVNLYRAIRGSSSRILGDLAPYEENETEDKYIEFLKGLNVAPHLLSDDRQIYSDAIRVERERRRTAPWNPVVESSWEDDQPDASSNRGISQELSAAIDRVNDMIREQAYKGNVHGSNNSNNSYLGILDRISRTDLTKSDAGTRAMLVDRIEELAEQSRQYSRYGLLPAIDSRRFIRVIESVPEENLSAARGVVAPFLESQQARMDALSEVASLVSTFTGELNKFFSNSDKRVSFKMSPGIMVHPTRPVRQESRRNTLSPAQLSSGERQILLLILNTVLSRSSTRLFLIDEPELSLNVKWQRQLMDAMLACTDGSQVQFLVATHSIEIVTGHKQSLARMIPRETEQGSLF